LWLWFSSSSLYIYQHLLIYRIRRELVNGRAVHLISENAADMIAAWTWRKADLQQSVLSKSAGYSPRMQASSSFEQIHPDDRERVKKAAAEARHSGWKDVGVPSSPQERTWLVLESTSSVIRNAKGEPESFHCESRHYRT